MQFRALKERPVFLYFHGNAGNRASPKRIETYRVCCLAKPLSSANVLQNLSERLNVNVLTIDYRGFGNSEGSPTENGLALDARAAWNWLLAEGVDAKNIILLGHSLGTGVAARLARDLSNDSPVSMQPRGIILQAPYAYVFVTLNSIIKRLVQRNSSIPDVAFEFRVFQAIPLLYPIQFFPSLESKFCCVSQH
jgi:abhydrolase domain-containing protein 12